MAVDLARNEIDRIDNLLRNFDWRIAKQEITEDDIILTIKKLIKPHLLEKVVIADS